MRIVGGAFRGRKFFPPAKKWPTRPTTDFAKEGLFNILQNTMDFEQTKMLDLFGGTGNHCYEFISRGGRDVTYVDKHYPAVSFVKDIAKELEIEEYITIIKSDIFKYVKFNSQQFDYIFAGPPYPLKNLDEIPDYIFKNNSLAPEGLLILEHNPDHDFKNHPRFKDLRKYGTTIFSFFR